MVEDPPMPDDATFIDRTAVGTAGTTVAIKDLIDVAGFLTTAGCRATTSPRRS